MAMWRIPWIFGLLVLVGLLAFPGCRGSDGAPIGVGVSPETADLEPSGPTARLQVVLAVGPTGNGLPTGINAAMTPAVTCKLTLVDVGNSPAAPVTLTKTAEVVGGKATVTFAALPVRPVIGEVSIAGGRIGTDSEFQGGCDLVANQVNTLALGPVGSRSRPDLLAAVAKKVLASTELLTKASTNLFATIEQALSGMNTDSATVYDDALARYVAIQTWGPVFPDGLIDANKNVVGLPTLQNKIIGLYFSASWCSPCRDFSPKLVAFRNANQADFEVILIPHDTSEASQLSYMSNYQMLWPTVPFTSAAVAALKTTYSLATTGIPLLVILSPKGYLIKTTGRTDVTTYPSTCLQSWKNTAATLTGP